MDKKILATLLSFFIPGLGQIVVKKQLNKGLLFAFGQLGMIILVAVAAFLGIPILMFTIMAVTPLLWLYNLYDAYKN